MLFRSIVSELTAITKYEYQSVVLMNTFPHFAKELSRIGMAEMHHLHILAQLIFKLGGDPRYRAHSNPTMGHFWSGQNVDYQCDFPSCIIGTLVPFCVIGNSKEFPVTQKKDRRPHRELRSSHFLTVLLRLPVSQPERLHPYASGCGSSCCFRTLRLQYHRSYR